MNYREAYELFASNGILFNHESERRGETFVTRKITRAAHPIKLGLQDTVFLGNLDSQARLGARRGLCGGDVADASTGPTGRLRNRHRRVALGSGVRGAGLRPLDLDWHQHVRSTRATFGPPRLTTSRRSDQGSDQLGWKPKIDFDELVDRMVEHDLDLARQETTLAKPGTSPLGEDGRILTCRRERAAFM